MYSKFFKRFIDIIASAILLVLLLPLLVIVYIVVAIKMGNPVIFSQPRPGKDEKIFSILKFRTMNSKTDSSGKLLPDEDRITKLGVFLRQTSIDELPQLINVLKGDMSLIGPRPQLSRFLPYYTAIEHTRHKVKPGITGLAQINGRNLLSWDNKLAYDVEYVNNITFFKDMKILISTIKKVIFRTDVESVQSILPLDEERRNKNSNS